MFSFRKVAVVAAMLVVGSGMTPEPACDTKQETRAPSLIQRTAFVGKKEAGRLMEDVELAPGPEKPGTGKCLCQADPKPPPPVHLIVMADLALEEKERLLSTDLETWIPAFQPEVTVAVGNKSEWVSGTKVPAKLGQRLIDASTASGPPIDVFEKRICYEHFPGESMDSRSDGWFTAQNRILPAIAEAVRKAGPHVRWFLLVDDDTVVIPRRISALLKELETTYNPLTDLVRAGTSTLAYQPNMYGIGGGSGLIWSRASMYSIDWAAAVWRNREDQPFSRLHCIGADWKVQHLHAQQQLEATRKEVVYLRKGRFQLIFGDPHVGRPPKAGDLDSPTCAATIHGIKEGPDMQVFFDRVSPKQDPCLNLPCLCHAA